MPDLTLKLHNISQEFNGHVLFKIHTMHIQCGDSIHLQGDNGSGKTTLMKIMAGLI